MTEKKFILWIDGTRRPVSSIAELRETALPILERNTSCVVGEYNKGRYSKTWERSVYSFLGLRVPENIVRLSLYSDGRAVFATFEENDDEWRAEARAMSDMGTVRLKTEAGEYFKVPADECVPVQVAVDMLCEFFSTKARPSSVRWKRSQ